MPGSPPALVDYLKNAIGPGTLKIDRVQLWDLYSRLPVYLDADLADKPWALFNYKSGDVIQAINAVAASPQYKTSKADTNLKAGNVTPYDMFIHGLSMDYQLMAYSAGTQGAVSDKSAWLNAKEALLAETYAELKLNEWGADQLTAIDAPAAGGVVVMGAQGTTAALTTNFMFGAAVNGTPDAQNFRSYLNEGPFWCAENSAIQMEGTWGKSVLTASMVYKPAATAAPTVFLKAVLKGMRVWKI